MKNVNRLVLGFLACALLTETTFADGGVIRIPLKTFTKPAADLVDNLGVPLTYATLAQMYSAGQDVSKLQPIENKYWQNKKFSAVDNELHATMPDGEAGIHVTSQEGMGNRPIGLYSFFIAPDKNPQQRFTLTFGLTVHTSMVRAALLRKLGYYQKSPKFYKKIKVNFPTTEAKKEFVNRAFCDGDIDETAIDCLSVSAYKSETSFREFISDISPTSIYVHGGYLEQTDSEVPSLFDGLTSANGNITNHMSTSRGFRALAAPFVVADLEESLMRVTPNAMVLQDGYAFMNYAFDRYFPETDYTDMRWMLTRMASLTNEDWDQIVAAGQYPEGLNQFVKALLLNRTRDLVKGFFGSDAKKIFTVEVPTFKYTSADGYIKDGRVTTEYIPGYPQRFSHGERTSPFESGDILRYMSVRVQSAAIEVALNLLNRKLDVQKQGPSKIEGIEFTKNGGRPIGYDSGYQAGVNFSASRIVTTGTFYGSQAPVQMVDNVSISGGIAYTRIMNELGGITNLMGGSLSRTRSFTHVMPLESMKQGQDIPWKDLIVPSKLKQLASPLKEGKLNEFIGALKVGEVFTITDSVGGTANIGTNYGLEALIDISTSFKPSVGASIGGSMVILRQTQITRTATGFQVFLRKQNEKIVNAKVDFNYLINILSIQHDLYNRMKMHTDAFVLDYNSDLVSRVDKNELNVDEDESLKTKYEKQKEFGKKVAGALRGLIFSSNADKLYGEDFKRQRFEIDHDLKSPTTSLKLFWFHATQMQEEKLLTIKKTFVEAPENSTVENKPITIVSHRKGELRGKDYFGFGLELFDAALQEKLKKNAPSFSQPSQNPSQMPYGRAEWRMIRSDSELTQDRVGALPSVSMIQYVWGGWSLKKQELDEILERVKARLKGTSAEGKDAVVSKISQQIIPDNALHTVKKIDFYRVSANLTLLPGAWEKLKSLVITPDVTGQTVDRARFLGRMYQKLSEVGGKARPEDKAIFKNIISMIGHGDEKLGTEMYMTQCKVNAQHAYSYKFLNGTGYECLEPWVEKIIRTARQFAGADLRRQNKLMTELLYVLEENIPLAVLLDAVGIANYVYFVEVSGFRSGDEDGDLGVWSGNSLGEPDKRNPYINGLFSAINQRADGSPIILPLELERSNLPAQ